MGQKVRCALNLLLVHTDGAFSSIIRLNLSSIVGSGRPQRINGGAKDRRYRNWIESRYAATLVPLTLFPSVISGFTHYLSDTRREGGKRIEDCQRP